VRNALRRLWARLLSSGWYGVGFLVAGATLVVLAIVLGYRADPEESGEYLHGWWNVAVILGIAMGILGGVVLSEWNDRRRFARGDRRQQIERLTRSLEEAVRAIDAIRHEIDDEHRLLEALERDLDARQQAATFTEEQLDAVTHLLRNERRRERRGSILRDLAFVVLGAVAGLALQSWLA
jgi:hypothetical protein